MSDEISDRQGSYDEEDDEGAIHEEWVPLGHGVSLILYTFRDGTAEVTWAIRRPGGGFTVHLGF
jgi:hypothetical protein